MSKASLCLCLVCICTIINYSFASSDGADPLDENLVEPVDLRDGKKQLSIVAIQSTPGAISPTPKTNDTCPELKFNCEQLQHRIFVNCSGKICGHCLPGYGATAEFTTCFKIKRRPRMKLSQAFLRKHLNMAALVDPDLVGLDEALKQRNVPISDRIVVAPSDAANSYAANSQPFKKKGNTAFIVMLFVILITLLIFMMIIALLLLCWCGCFEEHRNDKPILNMSDSFMDRKLAQSAQVYHFQHEKQRIIAEEQETVKTLKKAASAHESDEEGCDSQNDILEFPGPALGEQLEVRNPLFHVELPKSRSGSTEFLQAVSVKDAPPPYEPYASQR